MSLDRRRALHLSALGLATAAGCTFGFGGTNEAVGVTVENGDDATHEISVTITFDGSVLLAETVTLAPDESSRTTFENPDTAGSATVDADLDGSGRTTEGIRVGPGTGIRDVFVEISDDGGLSVYAGQT